MVRGAGSDLNQASSSEGPSQPRKEVQDVGLHGNSMVDRWGRSVNVTHRSHSWDNLAGRPFPTESSAALEIGRLQRPFASCNLLSFTHIRVLHTVRTVPKVSEEVEFGLLPALELCDRPRRAVSIGGKGRGDPAERGEEKMLTEMTRNKRAMKAVRLGLIVTSWTFLVLGFVLTHNA